MNWCLESVQLRPGTDNQYVVASSNLSGHTWNGALFLLQMPKAEEVTLRLTTSAPFLLGVSTTDYGNVDVKWLTPTTLAVGNDNGHLQIWRVQDELVDGERLTFELQYQHHDDTIQTIAAKPNQLLTGSWDNSIKHWNFDQFNEPACSVASFAGHFANVWCVDWSYHDENAFASVAQDQRFLLWDSRKSRASSCIQSQTPLLACAYDPQNEFQIAIGGQNGRIEVYDQRHLKAPLTSIPSAANHSRPIRKLQFNPPAGKNTSRLASVSDDLHLRVYELPTAKIIFDKAAHKDFPRGLAWSLAGDSVVTCGWDGNVVGHTLP